MILIIVVAVFVFLLLRENRLCYQAILDSQRRPLETADLTEEELAMLDEDEFKPVRLGGIDGQAKDNAK